MMHKKITILLALLFGFTSLFAQLSMRTNVSTFDVIPLNSSGYYNGSDLKGGFWNGHFYYRNSYDTTWESWSGFSVANHGDTIVDDYTNEFSPITGGAINGTSHFAVCFGPGKIIPEKKSKLEGFYITNTTYTYRSIVNGSQFSKKFGGVTGDDPDWFRLKIYGYGGGKIQDSTEFYLADYRNLKVGKYVINRWKWVDLSVLEAMDSLEFKLESSDTGLFGMNTPAYFAMDDFNAPSPQRLWGFNEHLTFGDSSFYQFNNVWNGQSDTNGGFSYGSLYFENKYDTKYDSWSGWAVSSDFDTSKSGLSAQYVPITATDVFDIGNEKGVAVSYGRSVIRFPYRLNGWDLSAMVLFFTNSSYPYKTMKFGDAFSKKFGGNTGNDPDYYKFYIIGYDARNVVVDTIGIKRNRGENVLADFRNGKKYINNKWEPVDLGYFKRGIVRLEFVLESSDTGQFGMNTPAYFCIDNIFQYPESIRNIKLQKLKLYPNPANTYIKIDLAIIDTYEIVDLTGKTILKSNQYSESGINIESLPPGLFFLKVYQDQKMYSARFIKN